MSWYYPYGFLAGMVSEIAYIYGNWFIALMFILCFGLGGWVTQELNDRFRDK